MSHRFRAQLCSKTSQKKGAKKKMEQPLAYSKRSWKQHRERNKQGNTIKHGTRLNIEEDEICADEDYLEENLSDESSDEKNEKTTKNMNKFTENLQIVEKAEDTKDLNVPIPPLYRNEWFYNSCVPTDDATNRDNQKLLNYYHKYVHIEENAFYEVVGLVDILIHDLQRQMRRHQKVSEPYLGNYLRVGSASENLKACQPDEFDVMLPIIINSEKHGLMYDVVENRDDKVVPVGFGLCCVKYQSHINIPPCLKLCVDEVNKKYYLSPNKLLKEWFMPLLKQAAEAILVEVPQKLQHHLIGLNLKKKIGTSIPLEVEFEKLRAVDGGKLVVSIDLVPALTIMQSKHQGDIIQDNRFLIATKQFSSAHDFGENYLIEQFSSDTDIDLLWRISYSLHEVIYINMVNERLGIHSCHGCCLKLFKTIKEKSSDNDLCKVFKRFCQSSYLLKTIFLHLSVDKNTNWSYANLKDRLEDFFKELKMAFRGNNLEHFFYAAHPLELNDVFPLEAYFQDDHLIKPPRKVNVLRQTGLQPALFDRYDVMGLLDT